MDDQKPNLDGSSPEPVFVPFPGAELEPARPVFVLNTEQAVNWIRKSRSEERRKSLWFAFAGTVVVAAGMLMPIALSLLTMYVPHETQALPSPVSKIPPTLRPEPKAKKVTWPTDGDGSLEVDGVPGEWARETWSGRVSKVILRYPQFGTFESIDNPAPQLAQAGYANRKLVSLTLPMVLFQLTNHANTVRVNNYSLAMTLQATVEVASGRAILIPTHFQLRLPRGELTRYVKDHLRPVELPFLGWKLRWSIHEPELHFDRRPIACKMEVDIEVWRGKNEREPLFQTHAHLAGEAEYNLKPADQAKKQQLDFALRIASLQLGSLPPMDAALLKSILETPVPTYPFRDADKPIKALVEHVTVHNFGISPSDDNAGDLLLQASCTRRATRP